MNFLQRWFDRMVQASWNRSRDEPQPEREKVVSISGSRGFEADNGLNIQVHQAIGGRIVSFRHYDRRTDNSTFRTYVIPDDQDFERELGKMITLESMRG